MVGFPDRCSSWWRAGVATVIWRVVRALLGFAFGVLIAFVWLVPARAETIAATAGSAVPLESWAGPWGAPFTGTYSEAQSRALQDYSAAGAGGWAYGPSYWSVTPPPRPAAYDGAGSGVVEWFTVRQSATQMGNGGSGWTYQLRRDWYCAAGSIVGSYPGWTCSQGSVYSCPAGQNWTLQGNQCTRPDCQYGRASDGTCTACPAGKYMANGVGGDPYRVVDQPLTIDYRIYTGVGATVPATTCVSGCTVTLGSEYSGAGSGTSGNWFWIGSPSFTGATCSSAPGTSPVVQPNTPEADCAKAGKQWGTVNGTVVCVDAQTTSTKKTSVVTGPGGGTTATTQTQTCTGGSCNSTTTVTNAGGGSSGTATNGTSTSTSAATGSQTQGDGSSACRDDPYGPACLGAPASGGGADSASGTGGGVSAVGLPGEALGCPAPVQVLQWSVPFDGACLLAGYVRPLVLALAWLGAGIFVVGGVRNG